MITVYQLPRNDLEAVRRFIRQERGSISADEWQVLFHLQDDPAEFVAIDVEVRPVALIPDEMLTIPE